VRHVAPTPEVRRTGPALLLMVLILTLGGCGGATSGEGETSSIETGGEETSPTGTGGEETTSAKTGGGEAIPADIVGVTLNLTPSGDSGVSGTAMLADTSGGLEMTLNVQNLPGQPGAEYLAHIHEGGTCAGDQAGNAAPVGYTLEPLINGRNGVGASTTIIPGITVVQLFSGAPKYVHVHDEATEDEVPPTISCADIYTTTGGD